MTGLTFKTVVHVRSILGKWCGGTYRHSIYQAIHFDRSFTTDPRNASPSITNHSPTPAFSDLFGEPLNTASLPYLPPSPAFITCEFKWSSRCRNQLTRYPTFFSGLPFKQRIAGSRSVQISPFRVIDCIKETLTLFVRVAHQDGLGREEDLLISLSYEESSFVYQHTKPVIHDSSNP
ncbi:hypothetical protein AVEN_209396-1 [Araneus ventricosus]|uniref:Uncharacterized protein n=1 Tax=Araneus ventricosus TaxID=182803 RepID=A0A4Y2PQ75_ARAVE|nr:hypothetical protein AVEN_209396-1 [Araneus ventricosus]